MTKTARLGFDRPFRPFAFLDKGRPTGALIELVAATLDRAGFQIAWKPLPLRETEPALCTGAVDALAFKGVTAERTRTMDFSPPLIVSGAGLFRRSGLPDMDDPRAFSGLRVAASKHGPFASALARDYPQLQLVPAKNSDAAFHTLLDGGADLAVLNIHAGRALAAALPPGRVGVPKVPYAPLDVAFAVAKGRSRELLDAFCAAFSALQAEGRVQEFERRWGLREP